MAARDATVPHVTGSAADPHRIPHLFVDHPFPDVYDDLVAAGRSSSAPAPTMASTPPTPSSPGQCGPGTRSLRPGTERQGHLPGRCRLRQRRRRRRDRGRSSRVQHADRADGLHRRAHAGADARRHQAPAPQVERARAGSEGRAGRPRARARGQRARPGRHRSHRARASRSSPTRWA